VTEPRILTDDELRQIGALQVTPGSWRVVYGTDVTHLQAPDDANDWRIAACETPESPGGCARNAALIAAAPDLRRTALYLLQRAERAEARVTELEAPGECQSLHKLRAEVEVVMDEHESPGQRARRLLEGAPGPWTLQVEPDYGADHGGNAPGRRTIVLAGGIEIASDLLASEEQLALMAAAPDLARDLIASEEREAALQAQAADLQAAIERVRLVVEALASACDREGRDSSGERIDMWDVMIGLGRGQMALHRDAAWLRSLLPTAPGSVPVLAPAQPAPAPDGRFTVNSAWRFK